MNSLTDGAGDSMIFGAKLISSERITPETSKVEVRKLVFRTDSLYFDSQVGSCIRVLAPGEYGSAHHTRLYSIADTEQSDTGAQFEICVRRCFDIDEASGEEFAGVASNYLCDLKPGDEIKFSGPVGYPFTIPKNSNADLLMIGMGTGVAPFRGLARMIYEKHGDWKGKVRLFHGARTGLESLYMNDINNDIGNYFDQPTFKAFQVLSPRPAFDAPIALDKVLERNSAEVWEMVNGPDSQVYMAGVKQMHDMIDNTMSRIAGSAEAWTAKRDELIAAGRWMEVLY
ncbi:MAG: FAD-binding oxidoreductase [Sideroxydans sp.]|nr:FAD-binding oxidoreductase [Sideroxydans sp.]